VRARKGAKPAPEVTGNGLRDEHSGEPLDHSLKPAAARHQADRLTAEPLPQHPLGKLFPLIEGDEFNELVASITPWRRYVLEKRVRRSMPRRAAVDLNRGINRPRDRPRHS
jgi:hypothetical protein